MLRLAAMLILVLPAGLAGADLTGKWSGQLKPPSPGRYESKGEAFFLELRQSGASITGMAGPNRDIMWPITKGKVEGSRLTFEVSTPSGSLVMSYALLLAGNELKGTVVATNREGVNWLLAVKRE